MVCLAIHVAMFLPFGRLTDRVGQYGRVMLVAAVTMAVGAMPLIMLLTIGSVDCDITASTTAQSDDGATCSIIDGNYSHCPDSSVSEAVQIGATIVAQLTLTVTLSLYGAALPVWMVTSFPPEIRYTAVGIGYNFAQAFLGGTAPLIATALIDQTHWNASPAIYLILTSIMSGGMLFYLECGGIFRKTKMDYQPQTTEEVTL